MSNETTPAVEVKPLVAADLLKSDHPLHNAFIAWIGENKPSTRQGRKFLAAHPAYRTAKPA